MRPSASTAAWLDSWGLSRFRRHLKDAPSGKALSMCSILPVIRRRPALALGPSPIKGSTKRRSYAMLHVPPISSPADAVRAAIVEEHRRGKL
jgi:hypothetical protein